MHDNIRNNTSSRAVARATQTKALASVIFFLLFPPFHEAGKEIPIWREFNHGRFLSHNCFLVDNASVITFFSGHNPEFRVLNPEILAQVKRLLIWCQSATSGLPKGWPVKAIFPSLMKNVPAGGNMIIRENKPNFVIAPIFKWNKRFLEKSLRLTF